MNIHTPVLDTQPDRADAAEALSVLRSWAAQADPSEIDTLDPAVRAVLTGAPVEDYPALARAYPAEFRVDDAYKNTLPDLQNGPESLIKGARQQIQHVGISNFRLPIRFKSRDKGALTLESSVTGTVSLEADKKGINMSRIMRTFYKHAEEVFSFAVIERALDENAQAT
jgi:GTP cyclohydrolase I